MFFLMIDDLCGDLFDSAQSDVIYLDS